MGNYLLVSMVFTLVLVYFDPAPYLYILAYLFVGIFAVGRWWSTTALAGILYERKFVNRAFPGEEVNVEITIHNRSYLPVVWLQVIENLPVELIGNRMVHRAFSLQPRSILKFVYTLYPKKRGFYNIGPLSVTSGDLFGITKNIKKEGEYDHLIVYPRIVYFDNLRIPSRSPMGNLKYHLPIFEDPSRVTGKRDYSSGDSLRRVDWKTSASSGRLQVKLFDPSIALDTAIFLNMVQTDYHYKQRKNAIELGIVVAGSITSWIARKGQAIGIYSNGRDPRSEEPEHIRIPSKRGKGQLMRVLEALALIDQVQEGRFEQFIRNESVFLPWGTTVILITGSASDQLFDEIFHAKRRGLSVVLVLCGPVPNFREIKIKSEHIGIESHHFYREADLSKWQFGFVINK